MWVDLIFPADEYETVLFLWCFFHASGGIFLNWTEVQSDKVFE